MLPIFNITHYFFIVESHINLKIVHCSSAANSFRISFSILSQRISTIEIYWCALTKKGYIIDYHKEIHGTGPLYYITLWTV
jgi:hypothetical protein